MTAQGQAGRRGELTRHWTLETDCGPSVRVVDPEGYPVTEWIDPTDVGLPRYCGDWHAALRVVVGEMVRRLVSDQWISAEEKLPGEGDSVLSWCFEEGVKMSCYEDGAWREEAGEYREWRRRLAGRVTHWMPLPTPPVADGEGGE